MSDPRRWIAVVVYAIAMALLEAARGAGCGAVWRMI
jgi:uncharacterized membrane protein